MQKEMLFQKLLQRKLQKTSNFTPTAILIKMP